MQQKCTNELLSADDEMGISLSCSIKQEMSYYFVATSREFDDEKKIVTFYIFNDE